MRTLFNHKTGTGALAETRPLLDSGTEKSGTGAA
jgi:hypothetical protein